MLTGFTVVIFSQYIQMLNHCRGRYTRRSIISQKLVLTGNATLRSVHHSVPQPRLLPAVVGFPVWPQARQGLDRSDLHVLPCSCETRSHCGCPGCPVRRVSGLCHVRCAECRPRPLLVCLLRGFVPLTDLPLGTFCTWIVIQLWVCTHLLPVSGMFFTVSLVCFN